MLPPTRFAPSSRRAIFVPALLAAATLLTGCGPTVSAHVVDVVVDDEGVVSHAVLSFPDHDEKLSGGDDSCGLFSGNCGSFTFVRAEVAGDGKVVGAVLETHGEGSSRTYDVALRRREDDPPVRTPGISGPDDEPVQCRVYHFTDRADLSGFGKPERCYGTSRNVTVTLTFRGGDDGR